MRTEHGRCDGHHGVFGLAPRLANTSHTEWALSRTCSKELSISRLAQLFVVIASCPKVTLHQNSNPDDIPLLDIGEPLSGHVARTPGPLYRSCFPLVLCTPYGVSDAHGYTICDTEQRSLCSRTFGMSLAMIKTCWVAVRSEVRIALATG
jgi:hypothetical protein